MIASLSVVLANGTSSKPYTNKGASIATLKTSATAYITKCSCSPVDNELMVWIKVQYKDGNNYYWLPSSSTYYYAQGTDVAEARKKVSHSGIVHADGTHYARCGSGSLKSYAFSIDA